MATVTSAQPHVLFVGQDWDGSNATSCRRAFVRLGCPVTNINEREFFPTWEAPWLRAVRRAVLPSAVREFNRAFARSIATLRPDLVFVFKGVMMQPDSLRRAQLAGAAVFNFYPDVNLVSHCRRFGNSFLECAPHYDCIFTPKRYHLEPLHRAGARRVEFLPYAYDRECHLARYPARGRQQEYETDVVVVATWGPRRAAILESMVARGFPYRLAIWGNQWERLDKNSTLRPYVKFRAVSGVEMSLAFTSSKIALAFLSPPDLHTARSFEIPAFGTLMLAERTPEHLEFFREDEEIACFGDVIELRAKIDYYMAHEDDRRRVAEAGHHRVVESGHDYEARMARVLDVYQEVLTGKASDTTASHIHTPQAAVSSCSE
jgi:spore maturation protein CgeB